MRLWTYTAAVFCLSISACSGGARSGGEGLSGEISASCVLGITNVNLIPMTENLVRSGQTILFSHTEILGISNKPENAAWCDQVIDGADRYLLPGLNDMHTHVESTAFELGFGLDPEPLPFDALMAPYLVNSITGMRVLSGSPDLLAYRDNTAIGDQAPRLVVASPMLSATPPVLPEPITRIVDDSKSARAAVREFAAAGYDLIKVRRNLKLSVYQAVIEEAHFAGLHVDGHVTRDAESFAQLLTLGQDGFAHLDELASKTPETLSVEALASLLLECGCYISTTIGVMPNISKQINDYDGLVERDEMRVMYPLMTNKFWFKPNNPYLKEGAPSEFFDALEQKTNSIVKPLYDAGVPLLAGSDAINPMIVPGYGLLDELDLLVNAGLSPFEALRTATVIPAQSVPGFERVGVLEPGRAANAVLLASNPLHDLAVLHRPDAVILNGFFLDQAELDSRLNAAINIVKQP